MSRRPSRAFSTRALRWQPRELATPGYRCSRGRANAPTPTQRRRRATAASIIKNRWQITHV
eukprot:5530070-Prorocentrum_lima.AAC.1